MKTHTLKSLLVFCSILALVLLLQPVAQAQPSSAPAPDAGPWTWNTFLGGNQWDDGFGVAADDAGNIYVVGMSRGSWWSPIRHYGGHEDAFVAKLNSSGVLVWNTFLGSVTGQDEGYAIAVDGAGNVVVTGASTDSWGSPIKAHSEDSHDVFVARLNTNGVLLWNTFMGGVSIDRGFGIALDGSGNVYVTGESHGTWGNPVNPPSSGIINQEVFVAKLNVNGGRQWNTFMGDRNAEDIAQAIAFDDGKVYVAGYSKNSWGAPKRSHSGDYYGDAFVASLNSSNGGRQWNTFLGGAGTDDGRGIAASSGTGVRDRIQL